MGAETGDIEALQQEICGAVCTATAENGSEKLGRALFDMTELARKLGVDAERALFETCRAYIAQFESDASEEQ